MKYSITDKLTGITFGAICYYHTAPIADTHNRLFVTVAMTAISWVAASAGYRLGVFLLEPEALLADSKKCEADYEQRRRHPLEQLKPERQKVYERVYANPYLFRITKLALANTMIEICLAYGIYQYAKRPVTEIINQVAQKAVKVAYLAPKAHP